MVAHLLRVLADRDPLQGSDIMLGEG